MINKLISFSIENKLIIILFTIALIAAGIWSMKTIPLDAVPDITNNQVQVITQAPKLGTEDVEKFITYPLELAMSNLPSVVEIRSISRSGLSLLTIVFEDNMGTYLPRQLVSEKLNEIKDEIPDEFGKPSIGPISTGLGEIYQYTLEVDSAYSDKYSITDLRTIQDWIIKRQMALVPGVIEVNAFGGKIKQYEVSINPVHLNAMDVSITDIYNALYKNNQNTGGGYIEKNKYANYIRGEGLVRTIEDIENIPVKIENGYPLIIKDVADVKMGNEIRYGAFTKAGKGEAVGGMILMLKGANSNNVIEAVKDRVEKIQKSLPNGVTIKPFFDRSVLIDNTTSTVTTNLMEGALIVIFVLVLLLGNWRGGLIVASTIPLSLLFAFIMMKIFGVWANLMSLGAIDFGIIVDGAVIIVESSVFLINENLLKKKHITKEKRKELVFNASSKMMNSAFFGQLIILIVFIPILTLQGVEGKMFQPMALTFIFAMIGVMILCLTYVPMMSSIFIKVNSKNNNSKWSWGDKFIKKIEHIYEKTLNKVLKKSFIVISSSVVLVGISVFVFTKMGGEFIPQLDEGDIAFHSILKPGSSLSEAIQTTTKIEGILLSQFPEIKQVMSRIGVADVPTDPMPMDVADCFILLHPKSTWRDGKSKEQLVEEFKKAVMVMPGINFEFTQPIEMRFNELISGVREDIAIKLFGDDLDTLASKAEEIGRLISNINGVADMKVESTQGLPQIAIDYQREKIAQYGLNIDELNALVETAFAGKSAGVIFEGEKQFDIVVRFDKDYKESIENIKELFVSLPSGMQIPLKEVANISYKTGPMQISRENTQRRTYVGINVRGRDIKTLVQEIQIKLDNELELPAGYFIRYGGAFENLERATSRLQIVIPLALGMIFLLIFLALKSFKQTTMIFIAIPFAAIGGVFSLFIRDMPFSISAGVGFIVLFGVAVLNGLVLMSGWNDIKNEDKLSIDERIKKGAKRRIRPILLTALTDILGFLPMAISTSSGAEVQRPLATVVIGGMITSTLLTLYILPILYRYIENRETKKIKPNIALVSILIFMTFGLFTHNIYSQDFKNQKVINNIDELISIAIKNNDLINIAKSNIKLSQKEKSSSFNIDKLNVEFQYGQFNSLKDDFGYEITQKFQFPTLYFNKKNLAEENIKAKEIELKIQENILKSNLKQSWNSLAYLLSKQKLLEYKDSLFQKFAYNSNLKYKTDESTYLEKTISESKLLMLRNDLRTLNSDIISNKEELNILIRNDESLDFQPTLSKLNYEITQFNNPNINLLEQNIKTNISEKSVSISKMYPDITLGYFSYSNNSFSQNLEINPSGTNRLYGFKAGISIPIFFSSYTSEIDKSEIRKEKSEIEYNYFKNYLDSKIRQQTIKIKKNIDNLNFYENKGLQQSEMILTTANLKYSSGEINYLEYFQLLNQALEIKLDYIQAKKEYNESVIEMYYLSGN